jgi:hypothetical protein
MHKSQLVPCHSESVRGPCSGLESEVWGGGARVGKIRVRASGEPSPRPKSYN